MAKEWKQIGGDVDPREHGAVLARTDRGGIEVFEITPNDMGPGYFTSYVSIDKSDLTWEKNQDVAKSHGHSKKDWNELSLALRGADRLRHWGAGHLLGESNLVTTWGDALPAKSNQIAWWR